MPLTTTPPNIQMGGLYITAAEVEDVINSLRNVAPSRKSLPTTYYYQQLDNLKTLKKDCEVTEEKFFSAFGFDSGTIRERTILFQQKVDEYAKKTGLDSWIGVAVNDIIDRLRPWFNEISFSEIAQGLSNQFFNPNSPAETNVLDDILDEKLSRDGEIFAEIIKFLNRQLLSESNDTREYLQIKRGLINYINFEIDQDNRTIGIVLNEGKSNISVPIRRKIKKALNIYNKQHGLNIPVSEITKNQLRKYPTIDDAFRDDVINVAKEELLKNVREINDVILISELKRAKNAKLYSVTRSSASVRGFLGEIANNAILRSLLNDVTGKMVIPTGSLLRNVKGRQEIPIDTVIKKAMEVFHIQVKNYTLYDGVVTFSYINQADHLITSRAHMPLDNTVGTILTQFFGAFHFNQPFSSEVYSEKALQEGYMSVAQYRDWIYSEFQSPSSYSALSKIFSANIDRIIKLDDVFNVKRNNFFGTPQLYINSFFRINKYYIPASLIIQAIMNTIIRYLQDANTTYNSVQVTSFADTWGNINTLDQIREDRTRNRKSWRGQDLNKSALDMAKAVRVSYNVTFDIGKILHEAIADVI